MTQNDAHTHRPACVRLAVVALAVAALLALLASPASARTTRPYQSSFGSAAVFGTSRADDPAALAVDQSNGDVYAASGSKKTVSRFTAAGAPHNFTAGPGAGTNVLTFSERPTDVAVDNSSGPLAGTLYVAVGKSVQAFASTGASLGAIIGTGAPGGVIEPVSLAVDQSNGDLYVLQRQNGVILPHVFRYRPASPSGALDDADFALNSISSVFNVTALAADSGLVYVADENGKQLRRFSAADFAPDDPAPEGTVLDPGPGPAITALAADPTTGQLYLDRGDRISVLDSSGEHLYDFGAVAYFGTLSSGLALKSAPSGPATAVYVADPSSGHQVDAFGPITKVPTYTYPLLASFGPDGTSATQFTQFNEPSVQLAFQASAHRVYAFHDGAPGIFGFNAAAPPAFPPLPAFGPLATAATGYEEGFAVDNTALPSAGNLYLASDSTDLLYGFDDSGAPLPGFPIDPAASPGAPDGTPKDLCGAAVDSVGNVWAANRSTKKILKYSSAGAYLGSLDTTPQSGGPCHLAFDSNDDLYADVAESGVWKYTAPAYTAADHIIGGNPGARAQEHSLAVDPSTHHLFVASAPSGSAVDEFDSAGNLLDELRPGTPHGIALDPASGDLYLFISRQVKVFGPGILLPEVTARPPTAIANTTATLAGEVITQGVALTDCRFQYVSLAAFRLTGFSDLSSGGEAGCLPTAASIPLDLDPHPVSAAVTGLDPNTEYRFRLLAANPDGSSATEPASFTAASPPTAETTSTPLRTTATATLLGRLVPNRASTTYRFQYVTDAAFAATGFADLSSGGETAPQPAGSGDQFELVSQPIAGLQPDTAYRYRLLADNGNQAGPAIGAAATLTTRASDTPPSRDTHLPGPPGSDRAWELVSMPDAGGNPINNSYAFSVDGDRALYSVLGGTPISSSSSIYAPYFSHRTETAPHQGSWVSADLLPPRDQTLGPAWDYTRATPDLGTVLTANESPLHDGSGSFWRLSATAPPARLLDLVAPQLSPGLTNAGPSPLALSADGSGLIAALAGGAFDPAFPPAANAENLYEIASGTPQLLSLIPGPGQGTVAPCGADSAPNANLPFSLSPDGSRLYFASQGAGPCGSGPGAAPAQLYMRLLDAGETKLVSPPPLSGPDCGATFISQAPQAAFFWTTSRLAAPDVSAANCVSSDGDVYRYDLATESLTCLTCLVPGLPASVSLSNTSTPEVDVAADGSRLYFRTAARLLAGAPPAGTEAIYRLTVLAGELSYVAAATTVSTLAKAPLSADGRFLVFSSQSSALNPLGGAPVNGGTTQAYLYDDEGRSLLCVSCPPDGTPPLASLTSNLLDTLVSPSLTLLADDGTLAFSTPNALLGADQNGPPPPAAPGTSSTDVYEWRDGLHLLVTDGLGDWPVALPAAIAISPSGRDLFFEAAAQYTPDAVDSFSRLYDARIGGGFQFPPPPKPCALEACQGTPNGAPEEPPPGTSDFRGPGNPASEGSKKCPKGKLKRKGKCVKKPHKPKHKKHNKRHHRAASHTRRAHR